SEVDLAASPTAAAAELALFAGERAPACLRDALGEALAYPPPPGPVQITVERLQLPADTGPSVGYRAVVSIGSGSNATVVYADLVAMRQGSVESSVALSTAGAPRPTTSSGHC